MRTAEQTANELVEKFIQAQDNTKFETSDENYRKCQSLNKELGSDIEVYWRRLAIQCAIISVDEIVKLDVFDANDGWSNEDVDTRKFWKQVKQELETRLK